MQQYVEDGDPKSMGSINQLCPSLLDKRFSYNRIKKEPLKLTILKLDGTSFEIDVAKNGKVADLKEAVEAAFYYFPQTVSWSHVWGHFCLAYDGHKLLSDNDYISGYEIKDGDQIQFIRHVSQNSKMKMTRSEKEGRDLDRLSLREIVSRKDGENEEHGPFL